MESRSARTIVYRPLTSVMVPLPPELSTLTASKGFFWVTSYTRPLTLTCAIAGKNKNESSAEKSRRCFKKSEKYKLGRDITTNYAKLLPKYQHLTPILQ
jgi:hypothetical protein